MNQREVTRCGLFHSCLWKFSIAVVENALVNAPFGVVFRCIKPWVLTNTALLPQSRVTDIGDSDLLRAEARLTQLIPLLCPSSCPQ